MEGMAGLKVCGQGQVEVEAMGGPRPIRERFPPPWRVEQIPGGYRISDADGRPLAYFPWR